MLEAVFNAFNIKASTSNAISFGSGLIHHTWKIHTEDGTYILQRINQQVFKCPGAIVQNINIAGSYLRSHYPDYLFQTLPIH